MFLPVTNLSSAVWPDLNSYFLILMLSLKEFASKDTYLKSKLSRYLVQFHLSEKFV